MMRRRHTGLAFVLATTMGASALMAQTYPHAFPRAGAMQVVDNDRVAVWEVVWHHGVAQPFHRHLYDMAGVYLRYGRIRVTQPDGTVANAAAAAQPPKPYDVPRLLFQRKDITHKEEGIGRPADPEQFAFQTDLKGYSRAYPEPKGMTAHAFPRDGARKDIDNDRVVFWDYTWQPGKPTAVHFHDKDRVEVFVTGGTLKTKSADGRESTEDIPTWSARFVEGGRVDSEEAVGAPVRAIVIELKQAGR